MDKDILRKDWEILKPVLEDLQDEEFQRFVETLDLSTLSVVERSLQMAWLNALNVTTTPILPVFVKYIKTCKICFVGETYDHSNSQCAKCSLKNRCWDRELLTYWETYWEQRVQEVPKSSALPITGEPMKETESIIDDTDTQKLWCCECDEMVQAVANTDQGVYMCPNQIEALSCRTCQEICDTYSCCGRVGDEHLFHLLVNNEELIERRMVETTARVVKRARLEADMSNEIKFSVIKKRYDRLTPADQLNACHSSPRSISEEVSRLHARIDKLNAIENPPERTVGTRDLSDWINFPVGSVHPGLKKWKTNL